MSNSRMLVVLLIAPVLACGGGQASTTTSSSASTTSTSGSETMSLSQFTILVAQESAPSLCGAPDAPLRACYLVDQAQCTELLGIALTNCASEMSGTLPAVIDDANASAVAEQVGECGGTAYHLGLTQSGLVRPVPECQH
jgi:hypothetical protein